MSSIKLVGKVKSETLADLKSFCRSSVNLMTRDVSTYAKGRYRLWLFHECNLRTSEITKGYYDDRLWNFCQRVYPGCNIGLLTFGGKVGNITSTGLIQPHRDHSYSEAIARTVNVGTCIFHYDGKDYQLNDGEIIEFNCKKIHGVTKIITPERFSINLWKLNENKGYKPIV
ncbi:cupin domain-containing protein [Anabaena azotica]|uniref:Aspartyl/asparaginy/proline hydroxylase domain-containing protein n=1 Tax=Anabaena azotica FACHB-119 TaxID=947527 RepID=A0ABR8CY62_9NOST|nr:hypothetical protein [Anabaena azotica]MBD2499870.1 hypothetical protein [Anabaena azotica FACHB-119]